MIVAVRVIIEVDGRVLEAEVVEGAGASFDEAARAAVLQFKFKPATRDGVPMRARIVVRVQFSRPAPVPIKVPGIEAPAGATAPSDTAVPSAFVESGSQPAAAEPIAAGPQEVFVEGRQREVDRHEQSAEAVQIVQLKRARRESASLGEVLSRVPGMSVRRAGGLGSDERMSMNGLSDEQIATFLDGVPVELAFFPFGVASFPVNLADRVEIYKGVVPIRLGGHALGGAVNLVTDRRRENGFGGSAQVGSFGEQRFTAYGSYRHEPAGFLTSGSLFFDHSDNDYEIDVEVPDARGKLSPTRVPRFHDDYRALGGTVDVGVVDRPWARTLSLRAYAVRLDKEYQHNLVMTVPYGEVNYGQSSVGVTGRYEVEPEEGFRLGLLAAYSYRTADFQDKAKWVYDWFGERVRARRIAGEIERDPADQIVWWHNVLGRAVAEYHIDATNVLTLASTPTFTTLTGDERIQADPGARDPLAARRIHTTLVSGLEYETNLFVMPDVSRSNDAATSSEEADYRLQNVLFLKHYLYDASSEEELSGNVFRDRDVHVNRFGFGNGVRFRVTRDVTLKASYEFATRLPTVDETFGDGVLVRANLLLEPEISHNANFSAEYRDPKLPIGELTVEANGFMRAADNLIVLLGNDRFYTHQNVYGARALGIEGAVEWTSLGKYLTLETNATWQEYRNASSEGTFRDFEDDRIPNRPWLFVNWAARLHFDDVFFDRDEIEPFYNGRYVHEFFRGWESQGRREWKQTVDSQVVHGVGLSYVFAARPASLTLTFELQNLFDSKNYDFFGAQKPGRQMFVKLSGDFE